MTQLVEHLEGAEVESVCAFVYDGSTQLWLWVENIPPFRVITTVAGWGLHFTFVVETKDGY
jgi:hypothetical protein